MPAANHRHHCFSSSPAHDTGTRLEANGWWQNMVGARVGCWSPAGATEHSHWQTSNLKCSDVCTDTEVSPYSNRLCRSCHCCPRRTSKNCRKMASSHCTILYNYQVSVANRPCQLLCRQKMRWCKWCHYPMAVQYSISPDVKFVVCNLCSTRLPAVAVPISTCGSLQS